MMKVLWIVNIPLPEAAKAFGFSNALSGTWIIGQLEEIRKRDDISLSVCCVSGETKRLLDKTVNGVRYIVLPTESYLNEFRKLYSELNPDVTHIYGSELLTSHKIGEITDKERTVLSIQGLIYICAYHFFDGIPRKYTRKRLFTSLLNKIHSTDIIALGREGFEKLGESEKKFISSMKYVIGRTEWDKACVSQLNREIKYYKCYEILRNEFLTSERWSAKTCEPHSVFMTASEYPIKVLHIALEGFSILKKRYPDLKIYVAGDRHTSHDNRLKRFISSVLYEYNGYIEKLIRQYDLKDNIVFLGPLAAEEMKREYLKANAYVLSSSVENGSNSLGEAMILGVPCVTSYVGGVCDMLVNGAEGYLFPLNAPYMLAHYLERVFEGDFPSDMCDRASAHSAKTYDAKTNTETLIGVYNEIIGNKKN